MKTKNINSKRVSIKASIVGVVCAISATLIMSVVASILLSTEKVSEEKLGVLVFLIQMISAFVGCVCSSAMGKGNRLIQSLTTAGLYYFVLMATTVLFLDGTFHGMLQGMGAIALGSAIPMLTRLFLRKQGNSFKIRRFSR